MTSPADIGTGFTSNFLIAGADATGTALLSNHTDTAFIDDELGLGCGSDPNGFGYESAENAYAQLFDVSSDVTIDSLLVGIDDLVEGNPSDIDYDGDGVVDGPPILDGLVPVKIYMFFGATTASFDFLGPTTPFDVEICAFIDVNNANGAQTSCDGKTKGCDFGLGDVNQDGATDLVDVAPFVALLTSGEFQCEADINEDDAVDLLDVGPFVDLLTGG